VYRRAVRKYHVDNRQALQPRGGDALLSAMLAGMPLAEAAQAADGLEETGMVELFSLLVQNGLIRARTPCDEKDSP